MREEKQDIKVNLQEDVAEGKYANLAIISHSSSEFVIDFMKHLPGMESPKVHTRIIMSPENAKGLLFALQDNIMRYEKSFGEIHIIKTKNNGDDGTFSAPIGNNNVEA